jgi:hypothetical protein
MASDDLGVDVGEFAARVLEEELSLDGIDGGKQIHKENSEPQEQHTAVLPEQNVPVRYEELQLTQQPESQGQEKCDGDDKGVGNHWSLPPGLGGLFAKQILIGERPERRQAPEALPKRA